MLKVEKQQVLLVSRRRLGAHNLQGHLGLNQLSRPLNHRFSGVLEQIRTRRTLLEHLAKPTLPLKHQQHQPPTHYLEVEVRSVRRNNQHNLQLSEDLGLSSSNSNLSNKAAYLAEHSAVLLPNLLSALSVVVSSS